MSKITLDFTDVKADLIPAGTYEVTIESARVQPSKNTEGEWTLSFRVSINDGSAYQGRQCFSQNFSLQKTAMFRIYKILQNLGVEIEEGEQLELETDDETGDLITPDLQGATGYAVVEINEWNGDKNNRVVNFKPAPATKTLA